MSLLSLPRWGSRHKERTFVSVSGNKADLPFDRLADSHHQVLHYWDEKRGSAVAPFRTDIDPADMRRALPHLLLWEADATGYRCRLAGTTVDMTLGSRLQGVALADISCPLLDEVFREFDAVRDHGALSFAERTMNWAGKPHLYYRHLLLPLRNPANEIGVLLSVITFHNVNERLAA
jgi:hypothetical protein